MTNSRNYNTGIDTILLHPSSSKMEDVPVQVRAKVTLLEYNVANN